jgi:transposase
MAHVTVMTGPERRPRWSLDERCEIPMAAFSPAAIVADVARQYEAATSLIYKWRREVCAARDEAGFIPAVMVDDHAGREPVSRSEPAIIVELARGARVTVSAGAPAALVAAALRALR